MYTIYIISYLSALTAALVAGVADGAVDVVSPS